jgi:hypothetical protein
MSKAVFLTSGTRVVLAPHFCWLLHLMYVSLASFGLVGASFRGFEFNVVFDGQFCYCLRQPWARAAYQLSLYVNADIAM